jgi:hypothetical protein
MMRMKNNLSEEEFISKLLIGFWLSVHLQKLTIAKLLYKLDHVLRRKITLILYDPDSK